MALKSPQIDRQSKLAVKLTHRYKKVLKWLRKKAMRRWAKNPNNPHPQHNRYNGYCG
jgi:hypothetical protein